jgi:hypothetical protein
MYGTLPCTRGDADELLTEPAAATITPPGMAVPHHVLIELGSRWSSSLVLAEAEVALHRWSEDVAALRGYGWGEGRRQRFEALVDRLRARHDAVANGAQPLGAAEAQRVERTAARRWHDRAVSILEAGELDHPGIGDALAKLPPPGEGGTTLLEALRAAVSTCIELRARLDPEAADDAFFAEGTRHCAAVAAGIDPNGADGHDRMELLETLDGEVYLTLRGLDRAGRRAFAGDARRAGRYSFQFLVTIQRGDEPVPARRSDAPQKP